MRMIKSHLQTRLQGIRYSIMSHIFESQPFYCIFVYSYCVFCQLKYKVDLSALMTNFEVHFTFAATDAKCVTIQKLALFICVFL